MKIYKRFKFSASHRLFYPSKSDEENKARTQLHARGVCGGRLGHDKGLFSESIGSLQNRSKGDSGEN